SAFDKLNGIGARSRRQDLYISDSLLIHRNSSTVPNPWKVDLIFCDSSTVSMVEPGLTISRYPNSIVLPFIPTITEKPSRCA
ncbi:8001_t:CDS:2, partial [Entrophospora sp. SA101]